MFRLPKYKEYFALLDLWIIANFFTLAVYVVFFLKHNQETTKIYSILSLILLGFFLVFIILNKSININLFQIKLTGGIKFTIYLILTMILASLISLSFRFIDQLILIFAFSIGIFILLILFRIDALRDILKIILGRMPERNIIIIGDGILGKKLSEKTASENKLGLSIKGIFQDCADIKNILEDSFKKEKIDEIIISVDNKNYDELMDIVDKCNGYNADIKVSSDLFGIIPQKIKIKKYYDIPVINGVSRHKSAVYFKFKRIVDVLLSLIGFIILTPVFLFIIVAIKLSSSGPVFYKQKRVGLNGELFDLYKFRSMNTGDGEDKKREKMMIDFMKNNRAQKIIDDTRVTRVGKFIRRTSIDELPQLYNVIKGNMSIVGPRPCLPYEFNNYEAWQKRRVKVLPGCTGVWQVSGRSSVSFTDSIILDLFYINNMSPLYDILLILKTFPVIFFSKGGV